MDYGIASFDLKVDLEVALELYGFNKAHDLVCIPCGLDLVIDKIGYRDFSADVLGKECGC